MSTSGNNLVEEKAGNCLCLAIAMKTEGANPSALRWAPNPWNMSYLKASAKLCKPEAY